MGSLWFSANETGVCTDGPARQGAARGRGRGVAGGGARQGAGRGRGRGAAGGGARQGAGRGGAGPLPYSACAAARSCSSAWPMTARGAAMFMRA